MKCKLLILTQQVTAERTVNFVSSAASMEIGDAGGGSAGILKQGRRAVKREWVCSLSLGIVLFMSLNA